ncbi:hypothetical protein Tco_1245416 [Tanacetum coccineum]
MLEVVTALAAEERTRVLSLILGLGKLCKEAQGTPNSKCCSFSKRAAHSQSAAHSQRTASVQAQCSRRRYNTILSLMIIADQDVAVTPGFGKKSGMEMQKVNIEENRCFIPRGLRLPGPYKTQPQQPTQVLILKIKARDEAGYSVKGLYSNGIRRKKGDVEGKRCKKILIGKGKATISEEIHQRSLKCDDKMLNMEWEVETLIKSIHVVKRHVDEKKTSVEAKNKDCFEEMVYVQDYEGFISRCSNRLCTMLRLKEDEEKLGDHWPIHDPKTKWKFMKPVLGERVKGPDQLKRCLTFYALANGLKPFYESNDGKEAMC